METEIPENKKYTLGELKKKLTKKERIFCHEYIIDWNGARSAVVAGYSEKTARNIAHTRLTKIHIQQYIDFIKTDYEKNCGISKTKHLNELVKIAFSSIAKIHDTWIKLRQFKNISDDQKECIESIETKTTREGDFVKVKLYSKLTALDQLAKAMGYNEPEKIQHSGEIQTPITLDEETIKKLVDKI